MTRCNCTCHSCCIPQDEWCDDCEHIHNPDGEDES